MSLSKMASKSASFLFGSAKVGLATFLTLHYVGGFVICHGPSMEPTLMTGNILLTDHISPRLGLVNKGDIVVAQSPENHRVCKRVVANPGDTVLYKGTLMKVPEDHVWLEGDHKNDSNDSRHYGPVHVHNLQGRCYCRIWPEFNLQEFSSKNNHTLAEYPKSTKAETTATNANRNKAKGPLSTHENEIKS